MLFCESAVNRPHCQRPWSELDEINDEMNDETGTDLHHLSFSCFFNFSIVIFFLFHLNQTSLCIMQSQIKHTPQKQYFKKKNLSFAT